MKKHIHFSARQLLCMGILLLAFSGATFFSFSYHRDEKRFDAITSQLFVSEMKSNTLNMHYTLANPGDFGIDDYEAVLPCYTKEGQLESQAATENVLSALRSIRVSRLSDEDAYLHTLLTRYLDNSLTLSDFTYYSEPLSPSSGMQSELPILLSEYTFRSTQDVEDYLSLLGQTGDYFASLLRYEQEKAAAGLLMPVSSLREVRSQCDSIVTKEELDSGTHFLQTSFSERLESLLQEQLITSAQAEEYIQEDTRLLAEVLLPAYTALGDGLLLLEDEDTLLSGLAGSPEGKAYYEALLISETGSYRSVGEIQEMLSAQLETEYEEIRKIVTDSPDAVEHYGDISFPLITPEEMLADLQARMDGSFPALPSGEIQYSVKEVSENLVNYTSPAYYLTAPLDDTKNHAIYINPLKTPDGLELYTTLAHEGFPGHLYQTAFSNRLSLEKNTRPVKELLWYGGYLEGWALYVEFLSYDYASALLTGAGDADGAILTQLEKHNRSLQLCLYSLLDTYIHYDNASYSRIAKLLEGFGITDSSSVKAIYSYIVREPGNYLKYYLGYLEILSLKEKAEDIWGGSYSELSFHSFFLENGPADFLSLEEKLSSSISDSR